MRTLLVILAVLFLLPASLLAGVSAFKNLRDAGELARRTSEMSAAQREELVARAAGGGEAAEMLEVVERPGKLKLGAAPFALTAVGGLALIVAMFLRKRVGMVAVGVVVVAAASFLVNPDYPTGLGPASAYAYAMFAGILVLLGAACAFGADRVAARRRMALTAQPA